MSLFGRGGKLLSKESRKYEERENFMSNRVHEAFELRKMVKLYIDYIKKIGDGQLKLQDEEALSSRSALDILNEIDLMKYNLKRSEYFSYVYKNFEELKINTWIVVKLDEKQRYVFKTYSNYEEMLENEKVEDSDERLFFEKYIGVDISGFPLKEGKENEDDESE